MEYEQKFETYLQGHIHPDVQPQARRLTHPTLGRITIETYLDLADHFQANHEAFDADLQQQTVDQGQLEL